MKVLWTDRGGEFTSQVFSKFCSKEGIKRHLNSSYSPQQNGTVERHNQIVLKATRSFLKTINVPESLCGEAIHHAIYVLNRMPKKVVKNMTPYEGWKGRKPTL